MSDSIGLRYARITQIVWLALASSVAVIWVIALTSSWSSLTTICHTASACANQGGLDASAAHSLSRYGISIEAFAAGTSAITATFLVLWFALGALIIWRKPRDRGAILVAYFLAVFPVFLDQAIPFVVFFLSLILFALLFPDGRFAPRWTRWLALAAMLASLGTILSDGVATLADVVILVLAIAMQIYRFRKISTWGQRQQTKWAIFGLAAAVVGFVCLLSVPATNGSMLSALRGDSLIIALSAIPVSIGLSVLRKRLWDIDRIIGRALLYSALSLALAGIYIGGVLGLQAIFRLAIGNGSAPAIALSTLAIVALFGPLRRRMQFFIDRRFYRGKYDAARTLSAFGERLRDQVDLAHLSQDLTGVVHDTLHPRHVSLWLREGGREAGLDMGALAPSTLERRP